jgi:hypothetical protein
MHRGVIKESATADGTIANYSPVPEG